MPADLFASHVASLINKKREPDMSLHARAARMFHEVVCETYAWARRWRPPPPINRPSRLSPRRSLLQATLDEGRSIRLLTNSMSMCQSVFILFCCNLSNFVVQRGGGARAAGREQGRHRGALRTRVRAQRRAPPRAAVRGSIPARRAAPLRPNPLNRPLKLYMYIYISI